MIQGILRGKRSLLFALLLLANCTSKLPERPIIQYSFQDLTWEQVLSGEVNWSKPEEMKYNFGYWKRFVWVKFEVINPSESPSQYILDIESPWVDEVVLTWKSLGVVETSVYRGKDSHTLKEIPHRNPVFLLDLLPNEKRTVFLKISNVGILSAPLRIWTRNSFFGRVERDYIANGIYFGIISALLLYNLLIFISVKEKAYLFYCLYLTTLLINYALLGGFFKQLLIPESFLNIKPYLYTSVNASLLFVGLFSLTFLNLKKLNPKLDRLILGSAVAIGVYSVFSFFIPYHWMEISFIYTFPYFILLLVSSGIYSYWKGVKSSLFFVSAWVTLFVGVIVDSLTKASILPTTTFGRYGVQIGTAFEVILFSLALGRRLRFLLEENITSQNQLTTIRKDLEIARRIQMRILPAEPPKSDHLSAIVSYLPLYDIGGDFYDYFDSNENELGIVIADVTGHGVSAALDSSTVKIAFRNAKGFMHSPKELMAEMNRFLCTSLNARFVSAAYVYFDFDQMKLTYSSAGNPPLILIRDKEVQSVECPGLLLGVKPNFSYEQKDLFLKKGDRLLIFTDGLYENLKPNEDLYSILFPEIQPIVGLEQNEFHQKLLDRLSAIRTILKDDITLISIDIV
ncbi:7TM diverse intracellular signaling [Leptospira yanagawae serovar Saopaulo str. Sao Paulo = ATCC 700523]|uniref:7TM diverse intracellular signaling n=1 Tax=Leptospira yanagawae serovar Saopaulo str. Sao Paulo = ATCC 700523 TaxID=1249483 RepID=A0A5E8H8U4_9LEPT|nr:7TM diverse intracellular signaling domain-containing protein [Leptospira yanagawae]EOQ87252.1 7TM diverse intracellular signaling [Leptospira yanagawae serovar Saopaulo str. Sao Paulo = ATCC 700523]